MEPANNHSAIATSANHEKLPLAIGAGLVAAAVGAAVWAVVTVTTGYQIGFMAIGIGFLVGWTIRNIGKSSSQIFGVAGASLALLGCVAGNILATVGFAAHGESLPFMSVLSRLTLSMIPGVLTESFNAMDLVFYGIATYEGYKLSLARA